MCPSTRRLGSGLAEAGKLRADEVEQRRPAPALVGEHVMGERQRPDPAHEARAELGERLAVVDRLAGDAEHDREQVLGAVRKLEEREPQMLFCRLELGDVDRRRDHAARLVPVKKRPDKQPVPFGLALAVELDIDALAVAACDHAFLAVADVSRRAVEEQLLFGEPDDAVDPGAANGIDCRRVAEIGILGGDGDPRRAKGGINLRCGRQAPRLWLALFWHHNIRTGDEPRASSS